MPASASWLSEVLEREISERILNDPRTTPTSFLGWPKNRIFEEVIEGGQADFDAPLKNLNGFDRALLYAKYNQTRHLDELSHAFSQLFNNGSNYGDPLVIDLGCGPFTAGLSIANVLGANTIFEYYGVDHYQSMRSLGLILAQAAKTAGGLHPLTRFQFVQNLETVNFGNIRGSLTIFVASYLLASPTLDVAVLVRSMLDAHKRASSGPIAVLYTNSARENARAKFPHFRECLSANGFSTLIDTVECFTDTTKNPTDIHYALFFKPMNFRVSVEY